MVSAETPLADWRPMEDVGFAGLIGNMERDVSDPEVGRYRFATDATHANRNGFVHGGLLMTIADHGMGLFARQGDNSLAHATIQFTMQFIAAVRPGQMIIFECQVIKARRAMVFMDGAMSADGEVVATSLGVWRRFHL